MYSVNDFHNKYMLSQLKFIKTDINEMYSAVCTLEVF